MKVKAIPCPLCCETHFKDLAVLRDTLVAVTTKQISCPLCDVKLSGLDKFTIHLFTHQDLLTSTNVIAEVQSVNNSAEETVNNRFTVEAGPLQIQAVPLANVVPSEKKRSVVEIKTCNENSTDKRLILSQKSDFVRCDICNICFSDTNILEMHKNLLHTNGFSCHLCHKRFKMQGSLMVHMRVAHYGFGQNSANSFRTNNESNVQAQKANISQNDNKQWECDVCLKKFTTKYFLKKHKRLHTGEMPYVCGLCGKSFTFQQSYHKHMLYHSEDKPHVCSECGRAFKELSTLHNHQRIHSGERPFACETCGKCFRQRVSYLVHRRIHTGAMPYRCTSCDKRFRYKVSQRTHKCKAQPPGTVVRQFGDLVQKLLQQQITETIDPEIQAPTEETFENKQYGNNEKCYSTINEECLKLLLYNGSDASQHKS